ncbi:MAG: hypothetical protein Q8P73_00005 [bacterium]|nr:hypothetical protein [bacterium]
MTDIDLVQAISVNLLRLAEWYYKDPEGNAVICERYLDQSKKLSQQVKTPKAQPFLAKLQKLSLSDSSEHTAERFLTLGVLLQHPQAWI